MGPPCIAWANSGETVIKRVQPSLRVALTRCIRKQTMRARIQFPTVRKNHAGSW